MPTVNETILVILVLLFAAVIIIFSVNYQSSPISVVPINVTIVEKYPANTYESFNGRSTIHHTDPPKIIDNKGDLYIVQNEDDWAKMQMNKTYNVMYASYPNAQKGKIVGINY